MSSKAASAPWDVVPPHEQLFVLITGANSGIGLGIGERLIDEFLSTRSLTSHLILLPTTRSPSKSLQTISSLRAYAARAAQTSTSLHSRAGDLYNWQDTVRRIHVLSLQLDLCDLRGPPKPLLGEVFTACLFGHYILAHELLPLLSRQSPSAAPGRIIWSSSLEATRKVFNLNDMQCFNGEGPYESAKRLTDILSLTATLPSAKPYSTPFLTPDDPETAQEKPTPPKFYLTHPGIVASTLFPVPWFLMWAYELALVLSRWLGSPWHTVDSYSGSKSAAWVALQEQTALDEMDAQKIKWGSSSNRQLEVNVKKTEVEGWGWEGKVESAKELEADTAVGVFKKTVGRKNGTVDVTSDDLVEFEELGAECWKAMETLRHEWKDILDVKNA
ncbi:Fc.00g060420.m01.CDS01 [Cosmosporella sp. VM-42]